MTWRLGFFVTIWIIIIAAAAMMPMFFFAKEVDEDEYLKGMWGAISALAAGGGLATIAHIVRKVKPKQ